MSGVKFAHQLEGGYEVLQMFPSKVFPSQMTPDYRSAHLMVSEEVQLPREFARHANGANSPPHISGTEGHVGGTQD